MGGRADTTATAVPAEGGGSACLGRRPDAWLLPHPLLLTRAPDPVEQPAGRPARGRLPQVRVTSLRLSAEGGRVADIALPERLRPAFAGLSGALSSLFARGIVAMGGGSMLEARWGHRVSTDIDLFIAPRNHTAAVDAAGTAFHAQLQGALKMAGIKVSDDVPPLISRTGLFLSGECPDGRPWSLATMSYLHPGPPQMEFVAGSGVRAASLTEIFMGKLAGRALNAGRRPTATKRAIPIRDCYDICVCAALEPEILPRIFAVFDAPGRQVIATNFRAAPRDLHRTDPKPVVGATWAVDLEGVAARIGDAVAAGDCALLPVAAKRANPQPRGSKPCP